jgi:hypothetical protein
MPETAVVPQVTIVPQKMLIGIDSVPTYDGTSSIEEFLNIVEETGTLAEWTDKQLLAIVRLKLRYKAKQYLDSEPSLKATTTWKTLKDSLKKQFSRQYIKGAAMKSFMECRQRTGETCRQFLTRLKLLANRTVTYTGDPASDNPLKNKLEQDITTQFTLGLMMPIKQRVLSSNPEDLDEALEYAEREESIERLLHPNSNREVRVVQSTSNANAHKYQRKGNYTRQIRRCTKCNKVGHIAESCRSQAATLRPQITCFTCNRQGHYSSNCPDKNWNQPSTSNSKRCYSCNGIGHFARDCTVPRDRTATQTGNPSGNFNAATFQPRSSAANDSNEASWE